ncbi:hypothetical protein V2J09_013443 [Rumex salicifolius]
MARQSSVTHADLAPRRSVTASLASKTGISITVICILCGLLCFILSLIAEATRSEVTWVATEEKDGKYECEYSGSGRTPLVCAAAAFVGLAGAMVVQHTFMLLAIGNTPPPTYISWDPAAGNPTRVKSLTWQAGFFFLSTWITFAVSEIMLLIGLSVESGHLKKWWDPRDTCLIIQPGVFTAAGVFALATVFLAAGLYASAIRMQWLCEEQAAVRQEILQASAFYVPSSPPGSPPRQPPPLANPETAARNAPVTFPRTLSNKEAGLNDMRDEDAVLEERRRKRTTTTHEP